MTVQTLREFERALSIFREQFPLFRRTTVDAAITSFDLLEDLCHQIGLSCCIEPERVKRYQDPTGKWTACWWFSGRRQQFALATKMDSKIEIIPHLVIDIIKINFDKQWRAEERKELSRPPHPLSREATK